MAGILCRKRRLRLAEAAAFYRGLGSAVSSDQKPIKAALAHLDTAETTANQIVAIAVDHGAPSRSVRRLIHQSRRLSNAVEAPDGND